MAVTHTGLINKLFCNEIIRNMEVYIDDTIINPKTLGQHLLDIKESFNTIRKHDMKVNPKRCAFGVSYGKF